MYFIHIKLLKNLQACQFCFRDRKKIKKFIKAKEEALKAVRLKRQAYVNMGQIEESPKRVQTNIFKENEENMGYFCHKASLVPRDDTEKQRSTHVNNNGSPLKCQRTSHVLNDNSSRDPSLCHIASMESLTDDVMKSSEKRNGLRHQHRPIQEHGNKQRYTNTGSNSSLGSLNLNLPEDYVTATKTLRRYSYQVACREPELDRAAPTFAKSEIIIQTYRSNNVAFENVAFHCDRKS